MLKIKNQELINNSLKYMVGGVNSPVRSFRNILEEPIIASHGQGSKLTDIYGNEYLDFIMSWGPLILGHNKQEINKEIKNNIDKGNCFGLTNPFEIYLSKLICDTIDSIDKIRLTTSGTEAVMTAIRLARAYTKKNKVIKFEGCYHGHSDSVLVSAGSAVLDLDIIDSNGVINSTKQNTISLPFNDIKAFESCFENNKNNIAAVIIEPVPCNMGVISPNIEFLKTIRYLTNKNKSLLIFDEVITGFRLGIKGAQEKYKIYPDLTTLGKIIGGGYPVGAVGGRKDIMEMLAPEGNVYHAGTLSGSLLSCVSGFFTLKYLIENNRVYDELNKKAKFIEDEISGIKSNSNICINRVESLFTIFFNNKVENMYDSKKSNNEKYKDFYKHLIDNKILFPPSKFEAVFLSTEHSKKDIEETIRVIKSYLQ